MVLVAIYNSERRRGADGEWTGERSCYTLGARDVRGESSACNNTRELLE